MNRRLASLAVLFVLLDGPTVGTAGDPRASLRPAADLMRDAVVAKLGDGVDVTFDSSHLPADGLLFRDVRIDPSARLGKPLRVTLVADHGASIVLTVAMTVTADHAVTTRAMARGTRIVSGDVESVRSVVTGGPLRRIPRVSDVINARVARPLGSGAPVLATDVVLRRAVEPGDEVTVSVISGSVEVTAAMVARDGGDLGDVIRVVSPGAKRYIRARVIKQGWVEVSHGR